MFGCSGQLHCGCTGGHLGTMQSDKQPVLHALHRVLFKPWQLVDVSGHEILYLFKAWYKLIGWMK
jgi:hypothetical protein